MYSIMHKFPLNIHICFLSHSLSLSVYLSSFHSPLSIAFNNVFLFRLCKHSAMNKYLHSAGMTTVPASSPELVTIFLLVSLPTHMRYSPYNVIYCVCCSYLLKNIVIIIYWPFIDPCFGASDPLLKYINFWRRKQKQQKIEETKWSTAQNANKCRLWKMDWAPGIE